MCGAKKGVADVPHQAFFLTHRENRTERAQGVFPYGGVRDGKRGERPWFWLSTIYCISSLLWASTDTICASEVGCQAACRPQKRQRAESRGGGGGYADMKEVSNVALARHPKHDINTVSLHSTQSQPESFWTCVEELVNTWGALATLNYNYIQFIISECFHD